jgi:serine/arginine repetitive matrix protein 2
MVILLRFMNTHGHHAAARKENQLQTVRGALGLDAEDVQKKGGL